MPFDFWHSFPIPPVRGLHPRNTGGRMIRVRVAISVFVVTLCAQTAVGQSIGSITGLVTNPQGQPVIGVPVWAIRTFALAPTTEPISTTVSTNTAGRYQFPPLVAGSYKVCVTGDLM